MNSYLSARWFVLAVIILLFNSLLLGVDAGGFGNYFISHSVVTVDPNRGSDGCNMIRLNCARNEYESKQIVLMPATDCNNVEVSLDLPRGPGLLATDNFSIRRVEQISNYKDVLVPCRTVSMKRARSIFLWLSIHVPSDAKPGRYTSNLHLLAGEMKLSIPVELKVNTFTLPVRPSIPAVFGIVEQDLMDRYDLKADSPELKDVLDNWYKFAIKYRLSPYFCRWLGDTMVHHCYPCPWPIGSKQCDDYLSDPRVAAFAIPFHDSNEALLKTNIFYLIKKGWLDRGYFYLYDEPTLMAQYTKIKLWSDKIHVIAPSARVLTTYFCGPKDGPDANDLYKIPMILGDSTQILCMSIWAAGGSEAKVAHIQQQLLPGQEWWSYVCMGPGAPQPNVFLGLGGFENRAVMTRVWKEQGVGFLYWALNSFETAHRPDAPISFRQGLPPGDGVLLYPGEPFGVKGPLASVRLERWRDGMEDYEYLKAVESKYSRQKALQLCSIFYKDPEHFSHDPNKIEEFRNAALSMLN